jgi:hypothetical protein
MPNPPAKTPEPKKAPAPRKARAKSNLGAKVKRTATNDTDAINKLYGSQS